MCRASAAPSRRNRRSIRPMGDGDVLKASKDTNHVPLHKEPRRPIFVGGNVLDDYNVLPKELGRGHYGTVRECVHRATRKTYACKSIDKSRIRRLDHLKNEVELMFEIDHHGIIKMVDCYEDREYVHIITEKYTGGELFDKIIESTTDKGSFSEERAAPIVKSLLEAIAYLHKNDIAHRDIKPENIMFATEDEKDVKLIDFGLARRHCEGDLPMSNPVGTAYYMAPELLNCWYDKSCDMWSVGTIVYILLSGNPPFNGVTDPDIFEAIKMGHFEFPSKQWSNKSDQAKDFIQCLLRMDPRKRLTAEEALQHPWIKNLGRKPKKNIRRRQTVHSFQPPMRSLMAF